LEESTKAESNAKAALEAQQSAEEKVRQAEEEQKAALAELKSQEDAYHGQIKVLEARSNDTSLSTVQKSKAVNELAQLKSQDPLPLRQAKITQEAKVKKVEKERKAQEDAYHGQIKALEQRSNDTSLSTVQKSKAVNELAQLKSQDPLPLRQAKITQEAKVKKVEKERKAQEAATAKATEAAHKAASAKKAAEEQVPKAEAARKESEKIAAELEAAEGELAKKFEAAQKALEAAKSKGGAPLGAIWWLEKELSEMKKFKPGTERRVA